MLSPKRTKFRKQQKGRIRGLAKRGGRRRRSATSACRRSSRGWITSRQIEAARIAIQRATKRAGKLYIRVFPDKPVTKKPPETRMGNGKGGVEDWVARGAAGPRDVRARGRDRGDRARGVPPRAAQAAGADALHGAGGSSYEGHAENSGSASADELKTLGGEIARRAVQGAPPELTRTSSTTRPSSAGCAATSRASRRCCVSARSTRSQLRPAAGKDA